MEGVESGEEEEEEGVLSICCQSTKSHLIQKPGQLVLPEWKEWLEVICNSWRMCVVWRKPRMLLIFPPPAAAFTCGRPCCWRKQRSDCKVLSEWKLRWFINLVIYLFIYFYLADLFQSSWSQIVQGKNL